MAIWKNRSLSGGWNFIRDVFRGFTAEDGGEEKTPPGHNGMSFTGIRVFHLASTGRMAVLEILNRVAILAKFCGS